MTIQPPAHDHKVLQVWNVKHGTGCAQQEKNRRTAVLRARCTQFLFNTLNNFSFSMDNSPKHRGDPKLSSLLAICLRCKAECAMEKESRTCKTYDLEKDGLAIKLKYHGALKAILKTNSYLLC